MKTIPISMGDLRREVLGQPWAAMEATLKSAILSCDPQEFRAGMLDEMAKAAAWDGELDIENGVATIPVEGVIVKRPSLLQRIFGGVCVMSEVLAMTEAALADEGVQAVRYAFDSPGGTATGVPEAATSLFQARQQTDKPMIGTVEGFCCSGAWWLGSQLDALYVSEGSRIGSMGVIAQAVDPTRMQKNAGLDTRTFASNSVKAGEGPDWERDIQAQVDRYHALFVSAVARGRGISIEAAMKMAGSRVFIGADAVAAGFADAVATGDEVMGQYGVKTAEKR